MSILMTGLARPKKCLVGWAGHSRKISMDGIFLISFPVGRFLELSGLHALKLTFSIGEFTNDPTVVYSVIFINTYRNRYLRSIVH